MSADNQHSTAPASPDFSAATTITSIKPRDAASLLLYRRNNKQLEVLLGKRPSRSSFMPDVYVFPGGGVERADARVKPATTLDPRCTSRLAVANSPARAQTLAMAAVRETFEETGLSISRQGKTGNVQHPSWQQFKQAGQAADLSALRYIGRAITPTGTSIRFHARFFSCELAAVPELAGQRITGNGELLDLRWVSLPGSIDLPLRSVTRFMLTQLEEQQQSGDAWIGGAVYMHKNGHLSVTWQS